MTSHIYGCSCLLKGLVHYGVTPVKEMLLWQFQFPYLFIITLDILGQLVYKVLNNTNIILSSDMIPYITKILPPAYWKHDKKYLDMKAGLLFEEATFNHIIVRKYLQNRTSYHRYKIQSIKKYKQHDFPSMEPHPYGLSMS